MADKLLYDVTKFGTLKENEAGIEVDDSRGREGDKPVTRLFPSSAGGGGQTSQIVFVNRYRPGNRYKYVRLNGTVVQFNAVKFDVALASEAERSENVINTSAGVALGNVVNGIVEFGNGGPLLTDPALTSHPAGTFGFMTVAGKTIANVAAAVVADNLLVASDSVSGQMNTVAVGAAYAQTEAQRVANLAAGRGARALVSEPPTQPSAWKANLTWIFLT